MMTPFVNTKLFFLVFLKRKQIMDFAFLSLLTVHSMQILLTPQYLETEEGVYESSVTLTFSDKEEFNEATLLSISPHLSRARVNALFKTVPAKEIKSAKVSVTTGPVRLIETLAIENHSLDLFRFNPSPYKEWFITKEKIIVSDKSKSFQGIVKDSFWTSAEQSKVPQDLIVSLSEIFSWQIDFNYELREGTKWRFLVEERLVNNRHFAWGNILAAEIEIGKAKYQAFLHRDKRGGLSYFDAKGERLKRTFLRSPIKYAKITSRFKLKRFHPMLKKYRPHFGVDYAAKKGTPVRVVGDGKVVFIGNFGSAGRMLKIQHSKKYTTAYMHLNRFPKGIALGVEVKQGQIIGSVGNSGLSTGPHLHFEFYRNGRYFNPLSERLYPKLGGVPKKDRKRYLTVVQKKLRALPEWQGLYAI